MKKTLKLFSLVFLLALALHPVSALATFGRNTFPGNGGSGGGGYGGLSIEPIYGYGAKDNVNNTLVKGIVTHNGHQYVGFYNVGLALVLGKRTVGANDWTFVVYDGTPKTPAFTGSGLNDMSAGGTYTGTTTKATYDIEIDSTGATDTFKWRKDGGAYTTGVSCAVTATTLSSGLSVVFGAITGHTLGDKWSVVVNQRIVITGDLHQGVGINFDTDHYMHLDIGSYSTAGGLNYRRSTSTESIDGLTDEIQISATYDAQASYFTVFPDNNGILFAYYRSNGASGKADEFLWKYDTASQTWSRAPGTRSSGVIGSFIDGNTAVRSAYMSYPVVDSNNFIHFVWSWQLSTLVYGSQRQTNISYVKYDATNGAFYKANGTSQTIPITLSNDDSIWDEPYAFNQGTETMAYRHAVDIDANGNPVALYVAPPLGAGSDHQVIKTGAGLNDLNIDYSEPVRAYESQPKYEIVVTSTGTVDQYKYRVNNGAYVTGNNMTTYFKTLTGGLRISFSALTGHTVNDTWTIYPLTKNPEIQVRRFSGGSWLAAQQVTQTLDPNSGGVANSLYGDGLRKRAMILHDGSTAYVIYASLTDGNGIQVLETADWANFKKYSLLAGGVTTNNDTFLSTFDEAAWKTDHKFYALNNWNFAGDTASLPNLGLSPVNLFYWDPATSKGFPSMPLAGIFAYGDLTLGSIASAVRVASLLNLAGQHIYWLTTADEINDVISRKAVTGDLLILGSGTYTISDSILASKAIRLQGQGNSGCPTTITSSTAMDMFTVSISGFTAGGFCLTNTGNGTTRGFMANSGTSSPYTGIDLDNITFNFTGTGAKLGVVRQVSSGKSINNICNITSSDSTAACEELIASTNSGTWSISAEIYNPMCNLSSGGGSGARCFWPIDSNTISTGNKVPTMSVYGGYGFSVEGAATTSSAGYASGGTDAVLKLYNVTLSGTDNDVEEANGATVKIYGGNLVNGTIAAPDGTVSMFGKNVAAQFMAYPPAAQTIAAGNTVSADACGGIKQISAAGAVTTDTTNTFTAPSASNNGCVMRVVNTGANNITLDNNANFKSAGGADVVMTADDVVTVGSNGAVWYQLTALEAN